jgi:hypothetical protein
MHAEDKYEPPPTVIGGKLCVTIASIEANFSRKHLFLDLQPYTCFYVNCSWSVTPFADRQLWSKHLELDHELGPSWDSIQCPLCLENTEPGKSAILIHFARHMEDIALAALPRDVESDAASEASSEHTASSKNSKMILPSSLHEIASSKVPEGALPPFADLVAGIAPVQSPYRVPVPMGTIIPPIFPYIVSLTHRCKIYELNNNEWCERGTGLCTLTSEEGPTHEARLMVRSEVTPPTQLFDRLVTRGGNIQRQSETLLVWTETTGTDMALRFQETDGCAEIWALINQVCPQSKPYVDAGNSRWSDREADTSHWTILERAEFRGHVERFGTNWTAIATVMGTKTVTMLKDHYFQLFSEGDTELQKLAVESDRKRHNSNITHTNIKQLREELEEKELRIVQLEQAVMALQQGGQTYLAPPVLQWVPDSLQPQLAELSDVDWLGKEHAKAESRLRQLEQAVMELQRRRLPQPEVEKLRADDLYMHKVVHDPRAKASIGGSGETERWVEPGFVLNPSRVPVNYEFWTASTGKSMTTTAKASDTDLTELLYPADSSSLPHTTLPSDTFRLPVPQPSLSCSDSHAHDGRQLMSSEQSPDLGPIQLPPLLKANSNQRGNDSGDEEDSTIKCICELTYDDGNTVFCEKCDTWQHIICYYESVDHVPDDHQCADCRPRPVDAKAANERRMKPRAHWVAAYAKHERTECGQVFTRANDLQKHRNLHKPNAPPERHTLEPGSRPLESAPPLISLKHPPKEQPESNNEVLPWIVKGYKSTFLETEKSQENNLLNSNLSRPESKGKQPDHRAKAQAEAEAEAEALKAREKDRKKAEQMAHKDRYEPSNSTRESGRNHKTRHRDESPGSDASDATIDLPPRFDEKGRKRPEDPLAEKLERILGPFLR